MTTPAPPRRRWFRYRLRTLFVAVLLLAIPLGWIAVQLKWIHDRRERLEWIKDGRAYYIYAPDEPSISFWRRWMGDRNIEQLMLVQEQVSQAELEEIRSLFPEAEIEVVTPDLLPATR